METGAHAEISNRRLGEALDRYILDVIPLLFSSSNDSQEPVEITKA